MKHTLIVMLALSAVGISPARAYETCGAIGEIAESLMFGRQNGKALSEIMSVMDRMEPGPLVTLTKKMAIAAFDVPRFSAPENQRTAVEDFRSEVEVACYKAQGQ